MSTNPINRLKLRHLSVLRDIYVAQPVCCSKPWIHWFQLNSWNRTIFHLLDNLVISWINYVDECLAFFEAILEVFGTEERALYCLHHAGTSQNECELDWVVRSFTVWFPSLHTFLLMNSYLDSAACLSMRAFRSSFSCWTFLRLSSNITFLSFWKEK